ncbi:MAG: response regulator transcription factor [Gemmatimonadaceae bacterium]|nr:response regulator transcription factor [Gemmatimonadaceae bacterium]
MSAVVTALADTSPVLATASVIINSGVIRVLLTDVHLVSDFPVRALLANAVDVRDVAEATRTRAAALAIRLAADVIITGMATSGSRSLSVIRQLTNAATSSRVLVMSGHPEDEWLLGALDAGAAGFVSAHASRAIR